MSEFPAIRTHWEWADYIVEDFLGRDRDDVIRVILNAQTDALRLEFGALLRIASWHGVGIDPVTRLGLPLLKAATDYYVPRQFTDLFLPDNLRRTYPPFVRVLTVALTRFVQVSDGNRFGPYLMVEDPPKDVFADLVTRYLW